MTYEPPIDTYGNANGSHQADGQAMDGAEYYSRDRYGSGLRATEERSAHTPSDDYTLAGEDQLSADMIYPEISRLRRRKRRIKRVVIGIAAFLVIVMGAGLAYASWFVAQLDTALAPEDQTQDEISKVLVPETPGQPFYILVMGSDSREGNYSGHIDQRGDNERSDVMMLVRIDSNNKKITLLSIPRDTPYQLEDGSYVKINELFNVEGPAGAITAVMNLTGLPVSHYASVRISGLEAIVDLLGGVTVDVPTELTYTTTDMETITIEEGRQTLNGREAQIFARARHEFVDNQDEHRQDNVRQLLSAIIKKVFDRPISELPNIVLNVAEYVDTDFKTFSVIPLAMGFSGDGMSIVSAAGPSEGDVNEATNGKWLCYLNPEGWQKVAAAVDAGEDPKGIDYSKTQILWTDVTEQPEFKDSLAHKYYYGG